MIELQQIDIIPFNGLKKVLTHKVIAEKIQKRYSERGRFVKGIREAIRRHGKRGRGVLKDSCHHASRKIVEIAKKYNALIVLEDLNKPRSRANCFRRSNVKLMSWTHRRIQFFMHYKALVEGLNVIYVNPGRTFKTSPIGGELVFINYKWIKTT